MSDLGSVAFGHKEGGVCDSPAGGAGCGHPP
jgi:hypothetical protein